MFKIGSGPTNSECFSHTPEGGTVSNFFSLVAPVDSRIWKLVTTLRPLKLEEIHEGLTSVLYDILAERSDLMSSNHWDNHLRPIVIPLILTMLWVEMPFL